VLDIAKILPAERNYRLEVYPKQAIYVTRLGTVSGWGPECLPFMKVATSVDGASYRAAKEDSEQQSELEAGPGLK